MVSVINLSLTQKLVALGSRTTWMCKRKKRSPLCRPGHRGRVRLLRTGLCNKPARYALSCGIKCYTQLGEQAHVRSDSSRHNDCGPQVEVSGLPPSQPTLDLSFWHQIRIKKQISISSKKVSWRTARWNDGDQRISVYPLDKPHI